MKAQIAVLPGDGIGPEIIRESVKVLEAIANTYGHSFSYVYGDIGAVAIKKTGHPLPDETLKIAQSSNAILFGAIGDPEFDHDPTLKVRPEQGLLKLRKELGLFTNIRPLSIYGQLLDEAPLKREIIEGVDLVIYRELTSGIYFGDKGLLENGNKAFDVCSYNSFEIDRILQLAFEAALSRRGKLCLVDKANVLETSRLWRKRALRMATQYPQVQLEFLYVDNAAMQMVLNPRQFDVIVTSNMFGDIISDIAGVIGGSIGVLPSASIGTKAALFEPIHGSYPQAKGQDKANPLASILSVAMLLEHLGLMDESNQLRLAVDQSIKEGKTTEDLQRKKGVGTAEVGDYIVSLIRKKQLLKREIMAS